MTTQTFATLVGISLWVTAGVAFMGVLYQYRLTRGAEHRLTIVEAQQSDGILVRTTRMVCEQQRAWGLVLLCLFSMCAFLLIPVMLNGIGARWMRMLVFVAIWVSFCGAIVTASVAAWRADRAINKLLHYQDREKAQAEMDAALQQRRRTDRQ